MNSEKQVLFRVAISMLMAGVATLLNEIANKLQRLNHHQDQPVPRQSHSASNDHDFPFDEE